MNIRVLKPEDAEPYHKLRLQALREHPEAFGSAFEDEADLPLSSVAERLQPTSDNAILGAWLDNALVGLLSFARYRGRKTRHRAMIGAMYVAPEVRGRGIGSALLNEAIHHARALADLEELILAVTVGNETARSLYQATGFAPSHIERRYIKVDNQYYDIEWMTMQL
ncbi:MAG: GNAT family N-acetyltransferase [Caldilineaceae bacterium]